MTAAELKAQNVLSLAIGPQQVRMVTHLDVSEAECRQAAKIIRETAGRLASGYGVQDMPWVVVTGSDGRILAHHLGWLSAGKLAQLAASVQR